MSNEFASEIAEGEALGISFGYLLIERKVIRRGFCPKPDILIKPEDICLVLHLDPWVDLDENMRGMQEVQNELGDIANFISNKQDDLNRTHIIGISNLPIAKIASRFEFSIFEVDVPQFYKDEISRSRKNGYSGPIMMSYMRGEEFVRKFQNPSRKRRVLLFRSTLDPKVETK